MAKPWLESYLHVPQGNVYGAVLEERRGRFTGATGELPIGQTKVELLRASSAAADGATVTGYGDHHTDVPFLLACDRGILVEELPRSQAAGCELEPARPFDKSRLPEPRLPSSQQ